MLSTKSDFGVITAHLRKTNSVRGALFVLKTQLPDFHDCHLAYEFMIDKTAFIRGGLITMTTLPKENTDKYWSSGGTNSDPVIENAASIHEPLFVDLEKLCSTAHSKFYKNEFFMSLGKAGCRHLAAYPFLNPLEVGFGVLTVFANSAFMKQKRDIFYYMDIGHQFHQALRQYGQVLRYFDMSGSEVDILRLTAKGQSASDIAQLAELSVRLVELRLQTVRKKLHCRTTTEAVFKATVHGIIP